MVFSQQRILPERCREGFVVTVYVPPGCATLNIELQSSARAPAQPTPTAILGLLGDLLKVPVNGLSIVASGDANRLEQVIVGAEIQRRTLETVCNIGVCTGNEGLGNHTGPEVLRRPVVAFVVAVRQFDARFVKHF